MKNFLPVLFSLILHGGMAGALLFFRVAPAHDIIYRVSLAAGPAALANTAPPEPDHPEPAHPEPAHPEPAHPEPVQTSPVVSRSEVPPKPVPKPAQPKPDRPEPAPEPAQTPRQSATAPSRNGENGYGGDENPGPYRENEVDEPPSVLRGVNPVYPVRARRGGLQGQVLVRLVVDERGLPDACEVYFADPPGYFEEAALAAARQTRFLPGKTGGRAVRVEIYRRFVFSLR